MGLGSVRDLARLGFRYDQYLRIAVVQYPGDLVALELHADGCEVQARKLSSPVDRQELGTVLDEQCDPVAGPQTEVPKHPRPATRQGCEFCVAHHLAGVGHDQGRAVRCFPRVNERVQRLP